MNYEFIKNGLDDYTLKYTDKDNKVVEIPFKRTIEMATKVQAITSNARIKMFKELTKQGMSKDDLTIRRDDGKGHITYDETNYIEFEKKYLEEETALTMNEIMEDCFKMNMIDLFTSMGIDLNSNDSITIKKVSMFSNKFGMIIGNKDVTPSEPIITKTEEVK